MGYVIWEGHYVTDTDYDCDSEYKNMIWDGELTWDEYYEVSRVCKTYDPSYETDLARVEYMKNAAEAIMNAPGYFYEPLYPGGHNTNWTMVDNFGGALEEARENCDAWNLESIFNGTQELALVPTPADVAAYKQIVADCEPKTTQEKFWGYYDYDCDW
jgi:hypothetical protein